MIPVRGQVMLLIVALALLLACARATPKPAQAPAPPAAAAPAPVATPTPAVLAAAPTPAMLAAAPTPQVKKPKYGGMLFGASRGDAASLDPMVSGTITTTNMLVKLSSPIIRVGRYNIFETVPHLAKSWELKRGGQEWLVYLRDDVKWHDGVQFTAEDVKFWLELGLFPPKGRPTWTTFKGIEKIDVLDPYSLRFTLKEPNVHWMVQFLEAVLTGIAHPKHLMQPQIDAGNVRVSPGDVGMVGVGPFRFVEYKRGSFFRVERNPLYWEKDEFGQQMPYLDGITIVIAPEQATMVAAFITGRIYETATGTGAHLETEHINSINRSLGKDAWWYYTVPYVPWKFHFNTFQKPWDDERVRKAIDLWVDRQKAAKALPGRGSSLFTNAAMFPPGAPFGNDTSEWPGWNPATKQKDQAEARRLLKESGYQGSKVTMLVRDIFADSGEYLVSELRDLGLDAEMKIVDVATYNARLDRLEFGVTVYPAGFPFQISAMANWLDPNSSGAYFKDERVDSLYREALVTADPARLNQLGREAERYVTREKVYHSFVGWADAVVGFKAYVKGVPIPGVHTKFELDKATVWLDK